MSQTDGPVPPTPHAAGNVPGTTPGVTPQAPTPQPAPTTAPTVKSLLRRPFKLDLGSAPAGPGVPAQPAAKPAAPRRSLTTAASASARPTVAPPAASPRPMRADPLAAAGHQSVDADGLGPGMSNRPPRPAPQLDRDQILDATAACLDEEGYDGTTIRKIAKRLDCAVGSIYRYFTDKRELLDAVVQRRFEAVAEAVEAGDHPDATARLYLDAARSGPEQYRLMFWLAAVGRAPDQPAALPSVLERVLAGWANQLGDVNAARCRWALLHGQVMLGHGLADCEHLPEALLASA